MITAALFSSVVVSAGSFAWGYDQAGFEGVARWVIAAGFFWLIAIWRKWRWTSSAGILLALTLSIFGLWFNFPSGWMFSGMIFALFAWDLTEFRQRIKSLPAREDIRGMERRHLARISFLALAGLLASSLFMFMRGQFTLEWGIYVLSVFLLGLFQIAAWVRG